MSDKDIEQEPPVEDDAAAEPAAREATVKPPASAAPGPGNSTGWLAFVIAIVALAAAGYTAWQDWRSAQDTSSGDALAAVGGRVDTLAESLAGLDARLTELDERDPGVDAAAAALRHELDERARPLEALVPRVATLEGAVASLAGVSEGARDAWILAESEYYMQIANAQLQLANNPHLAALALKTADERIVQLANPALTGVRRALSDELAALELMEKPDVEGATLMLASLARVVESLPLAGRNDAADEAGAGDPEPGGASRAWASVKSAMSGLVRVTPPERARLVRLSPDAEFFLRNNIALQLQAARLALLRGEQAIFEQTLDDTNAILNEYFDTDSAAVSGALQTIAEIRAHVFTTDAPDISGSLQLLRQFRAVNENAQ